jgi:hypothetical protein
VHELKPKQRRKYFCLIALHICEKVKFIYTSRI